MLPGFVKHVGSRVVVVTEIGAVVLRPATDVSKAGGPAGRWKDDSPSMEERVVETGTLVLVVRTSIIALVPGVGEL